MVTVNNNKTPTFEATQNAANNAVKTATPSERAASDYETFLTLMTTQMKNQDPLKPMDSTQFVSQLAQFSGVEQQVNMNKKLEELIKGVTNTQFNDAALYLGKSVTAPTGKMSVTADTLKTDIEYQNPTGTTRSFMEIKDKTGAIVRKQDLNVSLNQTKTSWNLLDNAGDMISNGTYLAEIISVDDAGNETRQKALTKNKVAEVTKTDTGYNLKTTLGDNISMNDVTSLSSS